MPLLLNASIKTENTNNTIAEAERCDKKKVQQKKMQEAKKKWIENNKSTKQIIET